MAQQFGTKQNATKQFSTNLKCGKCVAKVAPHLDDRSDVESWSVDTQASEKWLTVEGSASDDAIRQAVSDAGFKVLEGDSPVASSNVAPSKLATYRPLLLVVGYLIGIVVACELLAGPFQWMRAMRHFMAGFFLAFSFFKMLDLRGFADSFQGYDLFARAFRPYAFAYPFIELLLGVAYLANFSPQLTNCVTLVIMLGGIVGVTRVLMRKETIQCACLGTVFNLPMSIVTFIENGLMIVMACVMLAMYGVG